MIALNRYRKTLAKIQHDKEHFNYKNSTKKKLQLTLYLITLNNENLKTSTKYREKK